MFPFASDDLEARSALWSIIARILVQAQENEMNRSSLFQYVSVLVGKSDLIEDELLDCQSDDLSKGHEGLTTSCTKSNARTTAVSCFALVFSVTDIYLDLETLCTFWLIWFIYLSQLRCLAIFLFPLTYVTG